MKKRVKIDLSWRAWSLIVGFFILIGFVGLSFAYGGNSPSIHGHSAGEIEGSSGGVGGTIIVSSCMPNYSAGISSGITNTNSGTTYTAPSDGWFMGTAAQGSGSHSSIYINGLLIEKFLNSYGTGGNTVDQAGFSIPVRANDQVRFYVSNTQDTSKNFAKFYPCLNSGGSTGSADYVTESWKSADGSSWYRKWKSGWIEQGGKTPATQTGTVTFNLQFTSVPTISLTQYMPSQAILDTYTPQVYGSPSASSFKYYWGGEGYVSGGYLWWKAEGF